MIVPPEELDTTALRAALQCYVAGSGPEHDVELAKVLFAENTKVLIPSCYMLRDGEQVVGFASQVDEPPMKVLHVCTTIHEEAFEDDVLMVPFSLRKLFDDILWPGGYTGLVIDRIAPHSVLIAMNASLHAYTFYRGYLLQEGTPVSARKN